MGQKGYPHSLDAPTIVWRRLALPPGSKRKQIKMFTLIYNDGQLNKPSTMLPFLQANAGGSALLQVDCVTPFKGTEHELIQMVCNHLNHVYPHYEVTYNVTQNCSTEQNTEGFFVKYLVIQVCVKGLNQ